jgi:hypothetical protein
LEAELSILDRIHPITRKRRLICLLSRLRITAARFLVLCRTRPSPTSLQSALVKRSNRMTEMAAICGQLSILFRSATTSHVPFVMLFPKLKLTPITTNRFLNDYAPSRATRAASSIP